MQEYLRKFTERVIIAARTGEIEKQTVILELQELIQNKPENASEEMVLYLEFLVKVANGDNHEEIWSKLSKELKELFGLAIQKFKGNDIMSNLEELTKNAITAAQADENIRKMTISELKSILSDKPDGGSKSVEKYIKFLITIAERKNPEHLVAELDKNLLGIYTSAIKNHVESDMMNFFSLLTQEAFNAVESDETKTSLLAKLAELLSEDNPPPPEIRDYLLLLMAVAKGEDYSVIKESIPQEFSEIFDKYDV